MKPVIEFHQLVRGAGTQPLALGGEDIRIPQLAL
jgi:hypothetical protein